MIEPFDSGGHQVVGDARQGCLRLSSIEPVAYLAGVTTTSADATPSPADAAPSLVEAHRTAVLLLTAAESTRQAFESAVAGLGLTAPQARLLLTLEHPTPMRAIASVLHCDASNVTGIADRLTSRGLISREADPNDRRVKLLVLTAEGVEVRRQLEEVVPTASPVMAALDPEERELLRGLLQRAVGAPGPGDGVGERHC